tara:strand:+ start:846 stop:1061 length:216 start_codon:yes stop_codon:yes gene_type:complete
MSQLLSRADIERITDCVQPARQCKVLTDNKILFFKDRNGVPNVTWESLNNPTHLKFAVESVNNEPDFGWME